jgi:tyrosyl-tRNA synthetase
MTPPLLDDLEQRGLIAEVTHRQQLAQLLGAGPVAVYAGYDPTSDSLHAGNLVPTILLKRFQLAGHRPIVLVGGATGMIGDPSGKSEERNLLDDATIARNIAGIRAQLEKLLDFTDPETGALVVNNADWTRGIGFLEFLRDVGKRLTVNYMLGKDSVRSRIERTGGEGESDGISYTEFSYMLLQANDFLHLARTHRCRIQVGGSDQYGNITAGCELARKLGEAQLFGLVAPLLLDSTGAKMGKTATGERVDLDPARMSPYQFYQYWFNVADVDAPRLLRIFSLRPVAELDAIAAEDPAKRVAQRELARAVTSWVHGPEAIEGIEAVNRVMFGGTSVKTLSASELGGLARTLPTVELPRGELATGVSLVEVLARTKITKSKNEAHQAIKNGGIYVNDDKVVEPTQKLTLTDVLADSVVVLRTGKRNYHVVRVV